MSANGDGLRTLIAEVAARKPSTIIGVAVSGGSDSTALLQVLAGFARETGVEIIAATIDHGLRAASADEAVLVAEKCATLGVPHAILTWSGWDKSGNLQDAARSARYRLLGEWARANGCRQVWLGHTADDQAETFLMRLARGSGVDGLSAMPEAVQRDGIDWLRPFLGASRELLRSYLREEAVYWIDDPSNADPRFERIKFRNASAVLAELGLSRDRLNATAVTMARVKVALDRMTDAVATAAVETSVAGEVFLDPVLLADADAEVRLRLLARTLMWVSGAIYRPRMDALEQVDHAVAADRFAGQTLHGCVVRRERGKIVVRRELARVAGPVSADAGVWDGRWRVTGPVEGLTLAALGEAGLEQAENWRFMRLSREGLLATPGVWRGEILVAAPVAGMEAGFKAGVVRGF